MDKIKKLLKKKVIILDGATGTQLQKLGMPQGACPEIWCLEYPEIISKIHKEYLDVGSDVIYTCSFGANRIKLSQHGEKNIKKVNRDLGLIAKEAAQGKLVAADIGPTGKFVEPYGELKFDEAVDIFGEQVQGLLSAGVDIFVIETMMDIQEARAALIAVKELTDKFTMVTMTYEKDQRTLGGTDPVTALITLQSLGADAVGCNCSMGPQAMVKLIKTMKPYSYVPLVAKPNAGMPKLKAGETFFDMKAGEFSSFGKKFVEAGANILGGCCGTSPEHIKALKKKVSNLKPILPLRKSISALSSARKSIILDKSPNLTIVGESINPTGKKALASQLRQGKTSLVRQLAITQKQQGANLLDVNVGTTGIDEKNTLKEIIKVLSVTNDLPLVIDSSDTAAIEQALRIYPGRALINSISAEKKKTDKLLPLAAKYGAMFIILPLSESGIPKTFKARKEIIQHIFKNAEKFGFSKDDIIVDGLTLSVASHPQCSPETLKVISWCSKSFKVNSIIGLSNISFGMPNRSLINAAFLALAKSRGLSLVIANPQDEKKAGREAAKCRRVKKDKEIIKFLEKFSKIPAPTKKESLKSVPADKKVYRAVLEGNKEDIKGFIEEALSTGFSPDKLVHDIMVPAINKVGDLFDKKEYFLPQLIASAEAMKIAFERLEPLLEKGQLDRGKKTVIILATVKGDIHDIGKNIVALMLKNHGFTVIDLGKDVSSSKIIKEIKKHKTVLVGLSALMTTTMVNMKEVIGLAKEEGLDCRFVVGGAVVTKSYAHSLGAQYAADGVEAVRIAKSLSR